ncbi:MAG: hypothetical protein ACAH80_15235 [Alphaproteobacteria bacterium]
MGFVAETADRLGQLVKKGLWRMSPDDTAKLAEHSAEARPLLKERHGFYAKWRERAENVLVMAGVVLPVCALALGGAVGLGIAAMGLVAGVSLGGGTFAGAAMAFFGASIVGGPPMLASLFALPFLESRERAAAAKLSFLDTVDYGTVAPMPEKVTGRKSHINYLSNQLRALFNDAHDGKPPAAKHPKPAHVPSFGGAVLRPA